MYEIVLQDDGHTFLLLVDLESHQVVDFIDFRYCKPSGEIKSWFSEPAMKKPQAFVPRPDSQSWIARGEKKHLKALWDEKARPMAQRIDDAEIKVTHIQKPEAFNCRAGVIFCLYAMGMFYIPSPKTRNDYGTLCDIKKYNLAI